MGSCCSTGGCKCLHHQMKGVMLLVIGVAFLLQALGVLAASTVAIIWPIALILIAVKKLFGHMCKCCSDAQGGDSCCGSGMEHGGGGCCQEK